MRFVLSRLATQLDGRLIGEDRSIDGVSIDSRSVVDGQLFVPLVADRDGHAFIADAVGNGAAAYLTATGPIAGVKSPAVAVADTDRALSTLGTAARERLSGPVVGITGSVGKTSVKDLMAAACRTVGPTWASAASFNNELGVPLTLANAPDDTEITIVEMGARGIGHIARLCEVARPTVGIVTCVALAHSELFGSLDAVAKGKGELIEALPESGVAVLNADDPNVAAMASRTDATVITFGIGDGDVRMGSLTLDRLLRPSFTIESDHGRAELTLQVRGSHMALNATAALAGALAAGVDFADAVAGLATARLSPWRMDVAESAGGVLVVNDAYNANPTSMRAAIEALLEIDATSRVAVVGVMAELGPEGPAEHRAIAAEAVEAGIRVIAVGAPAYGDAVEHVGQLDAAFERLAELESGAAVLVKGSRVAGLERLAARLLAR